MRAGGDGRGVEPLVHRVRLGQASQAQGLGGPRVKLIVGEGGGHGVGGLGGLACLHLLADGGLSLAGAGEVLGVAEWAASCSRALSASRRWPRRRSSSSPASPSRLSRRCSSWRTSEAAPSGSSARSSMAGRVGRPCRVSSTRSVPVAGSAASCASTGRPPSSPIGRGGPGTSWARRGPSRRAAWARSVTWWPSMVIANSSPRVGQRAASASPTCDHGCTAGRSACRLVTRVAAPRLTR